MAGPIPKAALGRFPVYLRYIRENVRGETFSASEMARALELGEVQVRKDLSCISSESRPKIGYRTEPLLRALEAVLGVHSPTAVVVVGAGKLGRALMDFEGFGAYGLSIIAAFDADPGKTGVNGVPVYPMDTLGRYCRLHDVRVGILTVPAQAAAEAADAMVMGGITEIWNFAPTALDLPEKITVRNENLALSLAHLHLSANPSIYTGGIQE